MVNDLKINLRIIRKFAAMKHIFPFSPKILWKKPQKTSRNLPFNQQLLGKSDIFDENLFYPLISTYA